MKATARTKAPRALIAVLLMASMALAGCTDGGSGGAGRGEHSHCQDPPAIERGRHPVAVIETNLGTIEGDLYEEMAPRTVANFVCLIEAGYYNGISFHRIISNFMMQGGDPNTLNDNPNDDGQGGPGYEIPDEFHQHLRHDVAGVFSMANAGRTTGGSQFFITFVPTPHLDDRHTVFGQVKSLDVLEKVNEEAASTTGAPVRDVVIEQATIRWEDVPVDAPKLRLWTPDGRNPVPAEGGKTRFIVVVENQGASRADVTLEASVDGGTATIEEAFQQFTIDGRQSAAFVVTAEIGADGPPVHNLTVTARADGSDATRTLEVVRGSGVGPDKVGMGDEVRANYVGMVPDGRFFDTSVAAVGQLAADQDLWFDTFSGRPAGSYEPFDFTPGRGVIDGFTELANGLEVGGVNAGRMPPEKAYGHGGCQPNRGCLTGMTLLFQLEIIQKIE